MIRLVVAVVAGLFVLPDIARGEDVPVTVTTDGDDGVCSIAHCTLREALNAAGPGDVVVLGAETYVVEESALPLQGDTIAGTGARATIIAADNTNDRVLAVTQGANEVSGVTITGGESPTSGLLSGIGGGILVNGATTSLLMSNVTVTDNAAFEGGGIGASGGSLTILRSTISGNFAGAATDGAEGGGLWLAGSTTTLRNVTVSGNVALNGEAPTAQGGGINIVGGSLTANNVTVADNDADTGRAIYRAAVPASTVTLRNTIVSGTGLFASVCDGGAFSGDHNVFGHSSCGTPARDPRLAPLGDNTGQTDTHAIDATSPAVDGGAGCEPTDQRGLARKRACDIGAYEFQGNLPPSGGGQPQPPPPPGDEELPPPVAGRTVNALPESGTVKIKLPGSDAFVVLTEGQQIPVGTIVDARKGHVTLISAGGGDAEFYGGIFKIGQTKGAKPLTTLSLVEKLTCAKSKAANAAAKNKRKRRLWGDGKGRFRTKGRHSAATVVGTKWLVEDRCTSTLTRVARGRVSVRDFVKKKTVIVKAGKKYVARKRA